MHRRTILAGATSTLAATVGCLGRIEYRLGAEPDRGDREWSTSLDATEPELEPGEEGTLTVEASDVAGLTFAALPGDAVEIAVGHAELSPPADHGEDSYPPRWYWSARTAVEITAPVTVAADASPGEYDYEVAVFADDTSDAESITRTFTITVVEG